MTSLNTPAGIYASAVVDDDKALQQAQRLWNRIKDLESDNPIVRAAAAVVALHTSRLAISTALLSTVSPLDLTTSVDNQVLHAYIVLGEMRDDPAPTQQDYLDLDQMVDDERTEQ